MKRSPRQSEVTSRLTPLAREPLYPSGGLPAPAFWRSEGCGVGLGLEEARLRLLVDQLQGTTAVGTSGFEVIEHRPREGAWRQSALDDQQNEIDVDMPQAMGSLRLSMMFLGEVCPQLGST
jgi:hypothetical protein